MRISLSLEADLLERFTRYCEGGRFATRSAAVRQLMHERLTVAAWADDSADVAATLTLVYTSRRLGLNDQMRELRGKHAGVVALLQLDLGEGMSMDVIAFRGNAATVQETAAELGGLKGIQHAQLVVALAKADNQGEEVHTTQPHSSTDRTPRDQPGREAHNALVLNGSQPG